MNKIKNPKNKKVINKSFKVSEEESMKINMNAKEFDLSESEYMRTRCLDGEAMKEYCNKRVIKKLKNVRGAINTAMSIAKKENVSFELLEAICQCERSVENIWQY